MRKITIILFYILIAGIFFLKPSVTKAQQCAEWICNWDTYLCTPDGCTVECGCADAGYYTCPSAYYACNRPSGCCPLGGEGSQCECGVNAQGQCRSCNQPSCNWEYRVNCPDGAQRSPRIISSSCVRNDNLTRCTNALGVPVGTAQSLGGCCEEDGEGTCISTTVYTHECVNCAAGNTLQCGYNPGQGLYDKTSACWQPTNCGNLGDRYVSHRPGPETVQNRCYHACNNCGQEDEEWYWVYNVLTTCQRITCACVNACNTTPPSNISFNQSNSLLTWVPGSNGTRQRLMISANESDITSNCGSGSNCVVNGYLSAVVSSYPLQEMLNPNTRYFTKIVTYQDSSCPSPAQYDFTSPEPVYDSWWQVKDGDVTSNGNISSTIPDGAVFSDVGAGNYPGVPIYSGSLSMASTPLKISNPQRWNSNTQSSTSRTFNYQYFSELVPSDVVFKNINQLESSGNSYHGYEWYKVTGNHTISSSINFGNRKVLIFVEDGNLTIDGNLTLDDGLGFLTVFVGGNINIGSSLPSLSGPELEGLYLANGTFTTGESNTQLHLRGSVVALQGFNLQRNLDNNIAAAEIFEYAADQVLLFPEKLAFRQTRWLEVNP